MGFLDAPATAVASWPVYQPYSPATKPVWLDAGWEFFLGKPNDQVVSINTTTLNGSLSAAATTVVVTNATGMAAGEVIYIGTGATAETVEIESINTNTLTVYPRVQFAHSSGEICGQVWTNDSHPTAGGYAALAGWAANAKMPARGQLLTWLPLSTSYTDANGITTMAAGLESVVHASGSYSAPAWSSGTRHPHARRGNGLAVIGSGSGAGFKTLASIPVVAGDQITVEAHIKTTSNFPLLAIHDKDTEAVLASVSVGATTATFGWQNLGRKSVLSCIIPGGTDDIEIRVTQPSASAVTWYTDDIRVFKTTTPAVAPPYAIPDPGTRNLVVLGDSWTVSGYADLKTALEARCGRTLRTVNAGVSGERLDQQLARWTTDVAPYQPAVVVHWSCWMNELAASRSQALMDADLKDFITRCRSIGAVPVLLGQAPYAPSLTGSLDNLDGSRTVIDAIGA